jgi:hypothetical protein
VTARERHAAAERSLAAGSAILSVAALAFGSWWPLPLALALGWEAAWHGRRRREEAADERALAGRRLRALGEGVR